MAVVQYTYTHKQYRERHKTNNTQNTEIHRTTQKIHRATQQLDIFIVLRVDAVYVQVCNVGHWRSSRTSAVVPAPLGPQEMELLAMTWMRSAYQCFQVDEDLFTFMFICATAFAIRYCRNTPISFTVSVCHV